MIRAALTLALLCAGAFPALAQSRDPDTRPGLDARDFAGNGSERLPEVTPVAAVRPATRRGIEAPSAARRIDFRMPWQTGIYQ